MFGPRTYSRQADARFLKPLFGGSMQDIQAELAREAREQEMMRMSLERKASSSVTSSTRGGGGSRDISSDRGSSPVRRTSSPRRGGPGVGVGGSPGSDSPGDDGYWEGAARGRQQRSPATEMEEAAVGGRV